MHNVQSRFHIMRRHVPGVSIAIAVVVALSGMWRNSTARAQLAPAPALKDIVVLGSTVSFNAGCEKFKVYDLNTKRLVSGEDASDVLAPGRMVGNQSLTRIMAINAFRHHEGQLPFLMLFERPSITSPVWTTNVITGAEFSEQGGIALMDDGDTFFVSDGDNHNRNALHDAYVAKYRMSDVRLGRIGSALARVQLAQPASRIILSPDEAQIHILETTPLYVNSMRHRAAVRTFDTSSLTEASAPVNIAPITEWGWGNGDAHMTMSIDGRFLITNIRNSGVDATASAVRRVNIVDTSNRTNRIVNIAKNRDEMWSVAGVKFNYGWNNRGLLAVHGWKSVSVFAMSADGSALSLRGNVPIPPVSFESEGQSAPRGAIAWSASGDWIIAASNNTSTPSDFVVVSVADAGRRLEVEKYISACDPWNPSQPSQPRDILTANGMSRPNAPSSPSPAPFTASPQQTATPAPTCLCRTVERGVPAAVIANALANPASVYGWQQPLNPNLRPGPNNPLRTCLSLRNPNLRYVAEFNSVVWQAGCP